MSNYKTVANANQNVHFSKAMFSEAEHSRMVCTPVNYTTFNAGDLVPIYCREVLPHESLKIDLDFVIRQTTLLTPTMGDMHVDIYAFFVPNRVANQSWKAVMGENYSGSWTAPAIHLAPLVAYSEGETQIPVGSVADYYGFPTQQPIPNSVLSLCNDFKFRGYVLIWNEFFRDQNYQPPLPISTMNVFQGFLQANGDVFLNGKCNSQGGSGRPSDGEFTTGAINYALYGSGTPATDYDLGPAVSDGRFKALNSPLKVNKLHDYFTSVLPSPQKSEKDVFIPASGVVSGVPVVTSATSEYSGPFSTLKWRGQDGAVLSGLYALKTAAGDNTFGLPQGDASGAVVMMPSNLVTSESEVTGLGVSVNDLRMAAAIQQVYEIQARGGTRYREIVSSFFGIEAEDPYSDVPKCLGHISRDLDLYQTAQTSASESGNTPQGNLAAFGYTSSSGFLFDNLFLEHGYVHIFAVVRHRNIYSSFMSRDNFRTTMLDFYLPQLANISEQPVYAREINPFAPNPNDPFGYQEAWAEYRYEPDMVTGLMRSAPTGSDSLSIWNYADVFDASLQIANGNWIKSNSEEVLNRTLAVTSDVAPQFKASFKFTVDKSLPMPTYSVPGLDII